MRLVILLILTVLATPYTLYAEASFRDKVTDTYLGMLTSIDCYFGDVNESNSDHYKKISKNKLYVISSFKHTKDHTLQSDLYIRANIKLPYLSDRLELTLDKQSVDYVDNQTVDSEYERGYEDERFRLGVKYYFHRKENTTIYSLLGLKLFPPFDLFGKVGAQKSYFYHSLQTIIGSDFYYYLNQSYYTGSGSLTFFQPLSDTYGIEQKNIITYSDKRENTIVEHYLRLHHFINSANKLEYQLTYTLIDDDMYYYDQYWYGASIKYRHHINKALFFEMIPQILKRRENDFVYEKAFTFNFGITFAK